MTVERIYDDFGKFQYTKRCICEPVGELDPKCPVHDPQRERPYGYTPRKFSVCCDVDVVTVLRWIGEGSIEAYKDPVTGFHRVYPGELIVGRALAEGCTPEQARSRYEAMKR